MLASAITTVQGGRLYYRGQEAVQLAERAPLEDIAALLWGCDAKALAAVAGPMARATRSALARIVNWLREGYPGGVPEHDYVPLLALLERRLTRSEVKKVAKALRRADVSPAGPSDIAAAITEYTHADPSDKDLRRVRDQLAKKGWPVEFPDPDLP